MTATQIAALAGRPTHGTTNSANRCTPSTADRFLRGHELAFAAFGGVPRELPYDNLKSAVLRRTTT